MNWDSLEAYEEWGIARIWERVVTGRRRKWRRERRPAVARTGGRWQLLQAVDTLINAMRFDWAFRRWVCVAGCLADSCVDATDVSRRLAFQRREFLLPVFFAPWLPLSSDLRQPTTSSRNSKWLLIRAAGTRRRMRKQDKTYMKTDKKKREK